MIFGSVCSGIEAGLFTLLNGCPYETGFSDGREINVRVLPNILTVGPKTKENTRIQVQK